MEGKIGMKIQILSLLLVGVAVSCYVDCSYTKAVGQQPPFTACIHCKAALSLFDYILQGCTTQVCLKCAQHAGRPFPALTSGGASGGRISDGGDFSSFDQGKKSIKPFTAPIPPDSHPRKAGRSTGAVKKKQIRFYDNKGGLVFNRETQLARISQQEWKEKLQAALTVKEFEIHKDESRSPLLTDEEEDANRQARVFEIGLEKLFSFFSTEHSHDEVANKVDTLFGQDQSYEKDVAQFFLFEYLEDKYGVIEPEQVADLIDKEHLVDPVVFQEIMKIKTREHKAENEPSQFFIRLLHAQGPQLETVCLKAQKQYQPYALGILFSYLAKQHEQEQAKKEDRSVSQQKQTVTDFILELEKAGKEDQLHAMLFEQGLLEPDRFKQVVAKVLTDFNDDIEVLGQLPKVQEYELEF